ncbi:cytochrome C [Candidatus Falkowbacteria bacterium]|nr:cytochrome C [Candidatus Falkowbacteria bacterium]
MKAFRIACMAALLLAGIAIAQAGQRHTQRHACATQAAPVNADYAEACGACHFAYQPGLLPAASWERLLGGLKDHFGNAVELAPERREPLRAWLRANAADRVPSRRSAKLLRGLDGQAPLRITTTPWFQRKHQRLPQATFSRPSVGGAGNCQACHPAAARGDYARGAVRVPR